jgi:putative Mn2+ efflux pump MntP
MSILPIVFLAFSMSADAFAAACAKGAGLERPHWGEALRTGLIFGGIEAITPVVGWAAGRVVGGLITAFDHWVAFVILLGIGGKMIWDAARRHDEAEKPQSHSFLVLALTALGTSIDALAVGVTLALVGANILVNALAIGAATFTMTTIGVMSGRFLGDRFGRYAEAAGGLVLIAIGTKILLDHTLWA